MILALILIDPQARIDARPAALQKVDGHTLLELAAATVLRGPFGCTIVASPPEFAAEVRNELHGYAVQHVETAHGAGPHQALAEGLRAAAQFRQRWEQARAAAASRFQHGHDDDRPRSRGKGAGAEEKEGSRAVPADWGRHRQNPDVKVRGLARSFERDGVALFRAEYPLLTPELQAHMVEAFARGAAGKGHARPFAQAIYEGRRGFPVLLDILAAGEVSALPARTDFEGWLLDRLPRVLDVAVQEPGAAAAVRNAAELDALRGQLVKPLKAVQKSL